MRSRLILLLALAPLVMGQSVEFNRGTIEMQSAELSKGTIEGYVYSYDGKFHRFPGITVSAGSNADSQTAITDRYGHYIIFTATPGEFEINIDKAGYDLCRPVHVTVRAGFRYEVDLYAAKACY